MKPDTQSQEDLTALRRVIGCSIIYDAGYVRQRCELLYGRALSDRQWRRWRRKVRAEADPTELGGMSEATYVLLLTHARILCGNTDKAGSKKLPLERLVKAAEAVIGSPHCTMPEVMTYNAVKHLIELQALKSYTDRHHRRHGLKRSQKTYSREEASEILSKYPDFSYVYKHPKDQQAS